jgi:predicted ribosomally synthesized peptide with nif11-like leader
MATVDFENFKRFIQSNDTAKSTLRKAANHSEYMRLVVSIGQENGFRFTAEEYEAHRAPSMTMGKELSEKELEMVAGGRMRNCGWFDDSSGCSYGSCSFASFY